MLPAATSTRPSASSISVVVPVYRGGDSFRLCLKACFALSSPAGEIIVVVDGEDDGSGKAAKALGAQVLYQPRRSGPAAARNSGARAAAGDIILFIYADVVPPPNLIEQVAAVFAGRPDLSALIGSYDDAPGEVHCLSQYRNLLHHYVQQVSDEQAHTFWGACGAVRREAFFNVGGIGENIDITAMEEIELGCRLSRAGSRIGLFKDVQVKHLKRRDAITMPRTDIFQRTIPWSRLLARESGLRSDLNLSNDTRYSAVLAWIVLAAPALSPFQPMLLAAALAAGLGLLLLNAPLYRFFGANAACGSLFGPFPGIGSISSAAVPHSLACW